MTELFTAVIVVALICQVYVWISGRKVAGEYYKKYQKQEARKLSSVQRDRLLRDIPKLCPDGGELVAKAGLVRKVSLVQWALLICGCLIIVAKWFSE